VGEEPGELRVPGDGSAGLVSGQGADPLRGQDCHRAGGIPPGRWVRPAGPHGGPPPAQVPSGEPHGGGAESAGGWEPHGRQPPVQRAAFGRLHPGSVQPEPGAGAAGLRGGDAGGPPAVGVGWEPGPGDLRARGALRPAVPTRVGSAAGRPSAGDRGHRDGGHHLPGPPDVQGVPPVEREDRHGVLSSSPSRRGKRTGSASPGPASGPTSSGGCCGPWSGVCLGRRETRSCGRCRWPGTW
jgi:hypothetical protein